MDPFVKSGVYALCREIEEAVPPPGTMSPATQATRLLFNRVAGSWHSLCVLSGLVSDQRYFNTMVNDCGAILRCMYDAFIQAGYIVLDPDNADKQGTLYLEFAHVEQHKMYQEFKRQETKLANLVLDRNVDNDTEADLQKRFDAVKHHYRAPGKKNKHTNRLRNTWYEHDLRHLAKKIGQFDDYVFFLQRYHGSTHS